VEGRDGIQTNEVICVGYLYETDEVLVSRLDRQCERPYVMLIGHFEMFSLKAQSAYFTKDTDKRRISMRSLHSIPQSTHTLQHYLILSIERPNSVSAF
jgi:hypothetical protein